MGLNVNLVQMLGVSKTTVCPKCNAKFENMYSDYDIECGNPNPANGLWKLHNYCPNCEKEFTEIFQIAPITLPIDKK